MHGQMNFDTVYCEPNSATGFAFPVTLGIMLSRSVPASRRITLFQSVFNVFKLVQ